MTTTFTPVSLVIQSDDQTWDVDTGLLWALDPEVPRTRTVLHEALHYWHYLGSGFLTRLAIEDWQRMQTYEQTGEAVRTGPIRREFARRYPDIGFSARDLHECLARFWEIIAVGPRRVIDAAWSTRTQVNRDFAEAYRRHRMEAMAAGQRGWDPYDVYVAMLTIGGEYATPYTALSRRELNSALFVFPWLAYYALQTDAPAYVFSRLINDVAPVVADRAERAMHASDDSELFADVVNEIAFETHLVRQPVRPEIMEVVVQRS